MMNRFATIIAAVAVLASCQSEKPLSERVVRSEMARAVDAAHLDGLEGKLKWNYTTGLELKAFLDVYDCHGGQDIFDYVEKWYDDIIKEDGTITSYKLNNTSTDHICPGNTLFYLYDKTGKEKYRSAMDTLYTQLCIHPRTSEGGFWHKKIYPHQMWLDGLYMAQPFYAEYVSRYVPEEEKAGRYADIVNHFLVVAHHTWDPATKLYRHAWDESHSMFWCNPETGQSDHAWGRALGWYCMAIVETMPNIPEGTPGRDEVMDIFRGIFEVLPTVADPQTGMWYQVLDCPGREGNYIESTASAMFVYSMLKGIRLGYLDASLDSYAKDCYNSMISNFVCENADGTLDLTQCCAVAGLGGKDMRRGDYDYYIHEKICSNDPKGIGPLIWAALEIENE